MKWMISLLLLGPLWALPSAEEATKIFMEGSSSEREALTKELWAAGDEALPLVSSFLKSDDPEIRTRANFLYKRIHLGLKPDSPKILLGLAEAAMKATPSNKKSTLLPLLDEEEGFEIALRFLDRWTREERFSPEILRKLSGTILFNDRLDGEMLNIPMGLKCRGLLVAILANEGQHEQRIAINLALPQPLATLKEAQTHQAPFGREFFLGLARGAILADKQGEARAILEAGLKDTDDIARDLATLPTGDQRPPEVLHFKLREEGKWVEASQLKVPQEVKEDSLIIAGKFDALVDSKDLTPELIAVMKDFLEIDPADIEALRADGYEYPKTFAKILCALDHNPEAIEILHDTGNHRRVLALLLADNQKEEAIAYLEKLSKNAGSDDVLEARLYLANKLISSGDAESAQKIFSPLLEDIPKRVGHRQRTVGLAKQVFDLETALRLSRHVRPGFTAHEMIGDMGALFPGRGMTMALWTSKAWEKNPGLTAKEAVEKAETFLKTPDAFEAAVKQLREKTVLQERVLQEMAISLHRPEMIAPLEKKARREDDGRLLLPAIKDTTLPLPQRLHACRIALQITPTDPQLHAFEELLSEKEPLISYSLALGETSAWIKIGQTLGQSGKTEEGYRAYEKALAFAADHSTFELLKRLGLKSAREGEKDKALRLLQAAIIKGILEEKPGCADLAPLVRARATLRAQDQ
jgi:tetratricopeptide (TPR) repeat protein